MKKKILIITSLVALALVLSGIFLVAYSSMSTYLFTGAWSGLKYYESQFNNICFNLTEKTPERLRQGFGWRGFCGKFEISDDFKERVIAIAKADRDVQSLLDNGYNITSIMPIIKMVVEGDGSVSMKATEAIVTMMKDTTSRATARVDLENAKVMEVTVLTRTVIKKP